MKEDNNVFRSFLKLFRRSKSDSKVHEFRSVSSPLNLANLNNPYRSVSDLLKYEKMYVKDGVVFACINTIVRTVIGTKWDISSEDEDAKSKVEEFISKLNFSEFLSEATRHTLIYGDAFIEKIYNTKGDFVDLSLVDPKTIEIISDDKGNELSYIQSTSFKKIEFEPQKEMYHLKFYSIPSSCYGISQIGSNYDTIVRKTKLDEAVISAVLHHGFPKYHVKVGDISHDIIPSSSDIEQTAIQFQDINSKTEFITPDFINIVGLDTSGVENIEEYTTYFLNELVAGFNVPEEALGLGKGSTEASGKVRQKLFERMIRSLQITLENFVSKNIFVDIVGEETPVKILFRDISPTEEAEAIKWIAPLLNTNENSFGVLTKNEIRNIFNLPEYPEEEEKTSKSIEIDKSSKDDKFKKISKEGYTPEELYEEDFKKFSKRFDDFRNSVKEEITKFVEEEIKE